MFRNFAPLLLAIAPVAAHAQYIFGDHADFPQGPARNEVEAAIVYVDVEPPCSLFVDIGVDRAGKVVSAEVDPKTCTCADKEVQAQAVKAVRERVFNAVKEAPAVQRGRVTWAYREPEPEFGGFDVVPPPPPSEEEDEVTYDMAAVEVPAVFPGGKESMEKYMSRMVRYPADLIEGQVLVEFVVERDGMLSEVKLKRGLSPGLDKEAIRVVKSMPKWQPAVHNGKNVRGRIIVPVTFKKP